MVTANYHTHTFRCRHAVGTDRDYVEAAIKAGIKTLGFSDHAPQVFPADSGYRSDCRIQPEELAEYVASISALKEEYRDRIQILIGLEMEYLPDLFEDFKRLIHGSGIEYLLLSHHAFGNEYDTLYPEGHPMAGIMDHAFHETDNEARLKLYVDREIAGMRTGMFSYVAHPDGMNFSGDPALYRRQMRRLCEEAKACDLPLEINLLGLYDHRHYPAKRFWEIAGEVGNKAIIGCDAHEPAALSDRAEAIAEAERWIQEFGLTRTETIAMPLLNQ